MNAQLAAMIRTRDANQRARLAATVQADINAQARKILRCADILARLEAMGVVEVPMDDDEPIRLVRTLEGVTP